MDIIENKLKEAKEKQVEEKRAVQNQQFCENRQYYDAYLGMYFKTGSFV